jgi:hypothetical protein
MRAKLLDTYGSIDRIRMLGNLTGDDLASAFGHRGKKGLEQFQKQVEQFESRQEKLQTAIEKYGFTWEELGSKVQTMRLNETSRGLLEDMEILLSAGLDTDAVFTRMSGAFSKLVQQSIAAGLEIPIAMKPILEKLISMGLLVNDNGDKLKDLNDVKFSSDFATTMKDGFDGVIDKLDKLLRGLGILPSEAEKAADGVRNAFRDVQFPGGGGDPDRGPDGGAGRPPEAHRGAYVTPYGLQTFHSGGEVLARLQPGEFVLQRSAVQRIGVGNLARMNAGGGGGGVTVVIQANEIFTDDYTSLSRYADKVARALEHGFQSRGYAMPS